MYITITLGHVSTALPTTLKTLANFGQLMTASVLIFKASFWLKKIFDFFF